MLLQCVNSILKYIVEIPSEFKSIMNNLILASSDQERLALWMESLDGCANATLIKDKLAIDKLDALRVDVMRIKPQVLLLDYALLGLEGSHGLISLRRLCAETKIIIMSDDMSEEVEWTLLRAGIRGCCRCDAEPKTLRQVVKAVKEGELWIRRALIARLVDELSKTYLSKSSAFRIPLGLLSKLSQREYDIAVRVGYGETNKQIALACEITARTVKAHLTEIFSKLGVADRLNLALVLAAENRIAFADMGNSFNGGSRVNDIKPIGLHTIQ